MTLFAAVPVEAQRAFDPPNNVSGSIDNSRLPSIAVQGDGSGPAVARVFWHDFSSSPNRIWCTDDSTGAWLFGSECEPGSDRAWSPRAVAGDDGRLHLVWRGREGGPDDIYYSEHDGMAWSAVVNISATSEAASNPTIALSTTGIHVLWEQQSGFDTRFFQVHHDGVAWGVSSDTGIAYSGSRTDTLRLAAEPSGTLHAVWQDQAGGVFEVFHSERPAGGGWSAPESVSASAFEDSLEPQLAVDELLTLHATWVEQDPIDGSIFEVVHASRPQGGTWGPARVVSNQRANTFRPVIAAPAGRDVVIAWRGDVTGFGEIYYVDGLGATVQNISQTPDGGSSTPSLALDRDGLPCLAWEETVGPGLIDIHATCADAGVDMDSDGDGVIDGDDCAPMDPTAFAVPDPIDRLDLAVGAGATIELAWTGVADAGSGTAHEVAGGSLADLHALRAASGPCLVTGLLVPSWTDDVSPAGESRYYLVRAANACGPASGLGWGLTSEADERPACP